MKKIVGGALFKDGRLLVAKRTKGRPVWPGLWEIPGGKLEQGEDDIVAIKREFFEETGIKIRLIKKYWTFKYVYASQPAEESDYIVEADNFIVKLDPNEHTEFKWIGANEVDNLNANNLMKESMKRAFATMGT